MRVVGGREIHPVNVRVGGFYRAPHARRSWPRSSRSSRWRASSRSRRWRGRPACRARTSRRTSSSSPCARRARYAIESGRLVVEQRARPRARRVRGALRRAPGRRTRRRCTRGCVTAAGRISPGRSPATRSARDRLSPVAREAASAAGLGPVVPQPVQAASSCARSRSSTPSTRRCGCSTPTSRPTRRPSRSPPRAGDRLRLDRGAARDALAPLRDRRARARSSTRGSSRRPARTRHGSSRASPPSSPRHAALPDDELQQRCEQAVRSFDPCISCATHFLRLEIERC